MWILRTPALGTGAKTNSRLCCRPTQKPHTGLVFLWLVAISALEPPLPSYSQTPDSLNPAPDSSVYALAIQPDQRILVGGTFSKLGGQTRYGLGRLNHDGSLDPGFSPTGIGSRVYCLALQPDGKILVGGNFTRLRGQFHENLGRLNADGSEDASFVPSVSNTVYSVALQPDGKILLGGSFKGISGRVRMFLARLNSDGSVDAEFNPEADNTVYTLGLQPDGRVLAGGRFTSLAGMGRAYLARLQADGTPDHSFYAGPDNYVYTLAVGPDGQIVAGGRFRSLNGQVCNYVGKLGPDGTLESSFSGGSSSYVYSIALQADGKVLVGGDFKFLAGQACSRLGRFHPNGGLDTAFNAGASGPVLALAGERNGQILVGGSFTDLDEVARTNMGRLSNTEPATQDLRTDRTTITWLRGATSPEVLRTSFDSTTNGILWTSVGSATRIPGGWQLGGLSLPRNATLRARGFTTGGQYNGSGWFEETVAGFPAIVSQPGSRTNDAGTTAVFSIEAIGSPALSYRWCKGNLKLQDGDNVSGVHSPSLVLNNVSGVDAGGYSLIITNVFGSITSQVAELTVVDPFIVTQPMSQAVGPGQPAQLSIIAAGTALSYQWRKDGVSVIGGTGASLAFTNAQGSDAGVYELVLSSPFGTVTSTPAMLSVNLATADTWNPDANGSIRSMALQSDFKILVGGDFDRLGGVTAPRVWRLLANGAVDPAFSGLDYYGGADRVRGISLLEDGRIWLSGNFQFQQAGILRCGLQRLAPNGVFEASFYAGLGLHDDVYAQVLQADGRLLVGGIFTSLGGQPRDSIGRFDPEGSVDLSFNPGAYSGVNTCALQLDGKILVGGWFTNLAGQSRNFIGRLNADGSPDITFNPSADGSVSCLAVQADGKILVGGFFKVLAGQTRTNLGRLNADGSPDCSFNPAISSSGYNGSSVHSIALQADGRILVAGLFDMLGGQARTNLGRLYPTGVLDPTFNPGANGETYSGASAVHALLLDDQGRVLVGGEFLTLAGQARSRLGRLNNTYPATHSFSFDGSTINWLRGGASPEFWRTRFEVCTNGFDWVDLGGGARIAGGWQVTGLTFPRMAAVRARGFVVSGSGNSSGWFVEAVNGAPMIERSPTSLTNLPNTSASFSAQTVGQPPLLYQWYKDGSLLADGGKVAGTHTPTLTLSKVLGSEAGAYALVVSNSCGSVTSRVAIFKVLDPVITNPPASQVVSRGETVAFSVGVQGTSPVRYQWRKSEVPVNGGSASSLSIPQAQRTDAGLYDVVVSNTFAAVTSTVALLTVDTTSLDALDLSIDGPVLVSALQTDGNILLGGDFSRLLARIFHRSIDS